VNDNKHLKGFILILVASIIAVLFAIIQIASGFKPLALYNFIRAIIFASACIFLFRKPDKVNFTGPLKISADGGSPEINVKISYFLSYLFSVVNLAISLVLYYDP
jgi:hypothetical protein